MPGDDRPDVPLGRLRWLCRRGMKELDVLLEGFLLREGERLASGGWRELGAFLQLEDDRLWDLLQGKEPPAPEFHDLVRAIRFGGREAE